MGNIFLDEKFADLKNGGFEKLLVSRVELEKRILRKETDCGTDVALSLEQGTKLSHGDVVGDEKTKIVVEQLPEKVISVKIKNADRTDVSVLLGHIIGNRHRPIAIKDQEIVFPIQADTEETVFAGLFAEILDHIEITVREQIFFPHGGANIHGH